GADGGYALLGGVDRQRGRGGLPGLPGWRAGGYDAGLELQRLRVGVWDELCAWSGRGGCCGQRFFSGDCVGGDERVRGRDAAFDADGSVDEWGGADGGYALLGGVDRQPGRGGLPALPGWRAGGYDDGLELQLLWVGVWDELCA